LKTAAERNQERRRTFLMRIDAELPERLVFVDETAVNCVRILLHFFCHYIVTDRQPDPSDVIWQAAKLFFFATLPRLLKCTLKWIQRNIMRQIKTQALLLP
jgi:hypothetical protein